MDRATEAPFVLAISACRALTMYVSAAQLIGRSLASFPELPSLSQYTMSKLAIRSPDST